MGKMKFLGLLHDAGTKWGCGDGGKWCATRVGFLYQMSSAVAADSQLNLAASPIAAAVLSTEKTTVTTGASSQEPQDARKNFNYPLIKVVHVSS